MARQTAGFYSFNRGEVSYLALARVDVERLRFAAETQENMCPRALGALYFRPGTGYIDSTLSNQAAKLHKFIFSANDTALLEFTDEALRVLINDTFISRPAVTGTLTAAGSWSETESTGSSITQAAGKITFANVLKNLTSYAQATLNVTSGQENTEHALRIVIEQGPVEFRVGTSAGEQDVFETTVLEEGEHSLAFTPGVGTVYIQIESDAYAERVVGSVTLESSGTMILGSPYPAADLSLIRVAQSADVVFTACKGYKQQKIVRTGARSYSLVPYQPVDGPFPAVSPDSTVLISNDATIGNVTLTASKAYFKASQIGSLIRLYHQGQFTTYSLGASNSYSDIVRVSGVSKVSTSSTTVQNTTDRYLYVNITGTWAGTITLYRSLDGPDTGFTSHRVYTTNQTNTLINDYLDNIICWYKIGFGPSGYTSGTAQVSLTHAGGGGAGVARIISVTNSTEAEAEVLNPFANVSKAQDFRLSQWSDESGWPAAVALHEGRLWFGGASRIWGSVSDNFVSFDIDKDGDAGPIQRTIGEGPIANMNWLLPLNRLQLGCDLSIPSARSSTFDEPLTPTVFMLKYAISIGAAPVQAVKIDSRAQYIDASRTRAYDLKFDVQNSDYSIEDITRLHPLIAGNPETSATPEDPTDIGFVGLDLQRQPDTRSHYVRADGQVACLLYDATDNVAAWWRILVADTVAGAGEIEDVCVLPGRVEDRVYYVVKRTIDGTTRRYIEKLAMLHECVGGDLSKNIDCHAVYEGAPATTLTGLEHLEGETVCVWADGEDAALTDGVDGYEVIGGAITLQHAVSKAVVGLKYKGRYKSAKLATGAQGGTALNQMKRVDHVGFLLANTHQMGLRYGRDFDNMDGLPEVEDGVQVDQNYVWPRYDKIEMEFDGDSETDSRFCLECESPRPAIILGVTANLVTIG